jgi:hypothetical protein
VAGVTLSVWLFLGGALVGYVAEGERQRRLDYRLWLLVRPQPANTAPPTLTELNRPDWMEDA